VRGKAKAPEAIPGNFGQPRRDAKDLARPGLF